MEDRTVLFVDDDEIIRMSIERALASEPYNILFAKNGEEAIEMLEEHAVHVIVSDMRMPGISGLELLKEVKEKHPDIIRLVLSQYMQPTTLLTAINQGEIFKYVTKPWDEEGPIRELTRSAIDQYNLQHERERLVAELEACKAELAKYKEAAGE